MDPNSPHDLFLPVYEETESRVSRYVSAGILARPRSPPSPPDLDMGVTHRETALMHPSHIVTRNYVDGWARNWRESFDNLDDERVRHTRSFPYYYNSVEWDRTHPLGPPHQQQHQLTRLYAFSIHVAVRGSRFVHISAVFSDILGQQDPRLYHASWKTPMSTDPTIWHLFDSTVEFDTSRELFDLFGTLSEAEIANIVVPCSLGFPVRLSDPGTRLQELVVRYCPKHNPYRPRSVEALRIRDRTPARFVPRSSSSATPTRSTNVTPRGSQSTPRHQVSQTHHTSPVSLQRPTFRPPLTHAGSFHTPVGLQGPSPRPSLSSPSQVVPRYDPFYRVELAAYFTHDNKIVVPNSNNWTANKMLFCRSFVGWFGEDYIWPPEHRTPDARKLALLKAGYKNHLVWCPHLEVYPLQFEVLGAPAGSWSACNVAEVPTQLFGNLLAGERVWDWVHFLILTHRSLHLHRLPTGHRTPRDLPPLFNPQWMDWALPGSVIDSWDTDAEYLPPNFW